MPSLKEKWDSSLEARKVPEGESHSWTAKYKVLQLDLAQECSHNCSMFLTVSDKAIPKSTLSQHFRILREAGLIRGERRGVEMHNTSRCAEIENRFPGLLRAIVNAHTIQSNDEAEAKKRVAKRSSRRLVKNKEEAAAIAELTTRELN